ncbi:MAG: alanine:cation symporter family protein [Muribaculaceae bacterium]|nr:alanine:cation symporter family protein [Muribaculaceae bacterium]
MLDIINSISSFISDNILIVVLLAAAIYFTYVTRGVQFRLFGEMIRLLLKSGKSDNDARSRETDGHHTISSFQAFMVSIASRVGTGNLAGVATAIALGGPGAVFWMWIIALLGAASAFIESTLAQLYKIRGEKSFVGGPAYYISKGLRNRAWAICFAILITLTFGLAFNSVQANTIAEAFGNTFSVPPLATAITLSILTLIIIWGGIQSIARFSEIIVPVMAIAYLTLAIVIVALHINELPAVLKLIISNAFGFDQAMGGTFGMAVIMGTKRGLFSNEAGEGSAPNVAATASVSHPVKQGLIQSLGVLTDTLLVCSCTAFIILISGAYLGNADGIVLTQTAVDMGLGHEGIGSLFVSIAIFFFAFSSIVANYYYGETNLRFIRKSYPLIAIYRVLVAGMVFVGSIATLDFVWSFADITMALMTLCNLAAIVLLGKYAVKCLNDYCSQRRLGLDPVYTSGIIPEIAEDTPCWNPIEDENADSDMQTNANKS